MATPVGESSSAPPSSAGGDKPVIVRVKRKTYQSRLDAFWLEINERSQKRPLLNFANLSLSDTSSGKAMEVYKTKKVFMHHVETVSSSENTTEYVSQLFPPNSTKFEGKAKGGERVLTYKADSRLEQVLSKSKQDQQVLAKNARFQQIWSRRTGKETLNDKSLHDVCHLYDVVRVEDEERSKESQKQEALGEEDQRMLRSYLPLLREFIPSAAEEIESDTHAYVEEKFVYDYYTVKDEMDVVDEDKSVSLPLLQVEEEDDFYDELDNDSEYNTEDSNAEHHPRNDYPDEESEEEDEEESETLEDESEEEDEENDGNESESLELESYLKRQLQAEDLRNDDKVYDYSDYYDSVNEEEYADYAENCGYFDDGGDDDYGYY